MRTGLPLLDRVRWLDRDRDWWGYVGTKKGPNISQSLFRKKKKAKMSSMLGRFVNIRVYTHVCRGKDDLASYDRPDP